MAEKMWVEIEQVVWDRHPDHEGGELYLAPDMGACEVVLTPGVRQALAQGRIRETSKREARAAVREAEEEQEQVTEARNPNPPEAQRRR